MPRLPLINRIKATEILDGDIIEINRKILSEIAFHEPVAFKVIVEKAKSSLTV